MSKDLGWVTEAVARAIRDGLAKWDKEDNSPPLTWEQMTVETPKVAEMYCVMADAAIAAMQAVAPAGDGERYREALDEAFRRYPGAHDALAFFSAASGLHPEAAASDQVKP